MPRMSGLPPAFPRQMEAWIFPLGYILPLNYRKLLLYCQRLSSILSFCKVLPPSPSHLIKMSLGS